MVIRSGAGLISAAALRLFGTLVLLRRICWKAGVLLLFASTSVAADFETVTWRGKQVLLMTGAIDSGTARKFSAVADRIAPAAHGYPILLLDSRGGEVFEAMLLAAAVRSRNFHTVVPDGAMCGSACASIVFVAGTYRTVGQFGFLGQHSCSVAGTPVPECNELISQFAGLSGVSHGSIAAFLNYTAPDDAVWLGREDVDGWGISHYPGSESSGFSKSEPRVIRMLTGHFPPAQASWRLDFWGDGWRAFNRPASDAERELQISQFCHEDIPGVLFLGMEIHGPADRVRDAIEMVHIDTDAFSLQTGVPQVWQEDDLATMVAVRIPTSQVKPWLLTASEYEFRIEMKPGYDPITASGYLSRSRDNLIFAANHCSSGATIPAVRLLE